MASLERALMLTMARVLRDRLIIALQPIGFKGIHSPHCLGFSVLYLQARFQPLANQSIISALSVILPLASNRWMIHFQ